MPCVAVITTVAVADLVMSCLVVALTCTLAGDGTAAGVVYKPADVTVPHVLPLHPEPLTDHVTAVFEVPETDAVNCCFELVRTLLLPGETVTVITGDVLPTRI